MWPDPHGLEVQTDDLGARSLASQSSQTAIFWFSLRAFLSSGNKTKATEKGKQHLHVACTWMCLCKALSPSLPPLLSSPCPILKCGTDRNCYCDSPPIYLGVSWLTCAPRTPLSPGLSALACCFLHLFCWPLGISWGAHWNSAHSYNTSSSPTVPVDTLSLFPAFTSLLFYNKY